MGTSDEVEAQLVRQRRLSGAFSEGRSQELEVRRASVRSLLAGVAVGLAVAMLVGVMGVARSSWRAAREKEEAAEQAAAAQQLEAEQAAGGGDGDAARSRSSSTVLPTSPSRSSAGPTIRQTPAAVAGSGAGSSRAVGSREAVSSRGNGLASGSTTPITTRPATPVSPALSAPALSAPEVSAANGAATATWDAPADASIEGIEVTAWPGEHTVIADPDAERATVHGLDNGTPYRFTLASVGSWGVGEDSAPSAPVVPLDSLAAPPPAPVDVDALPLQSAATVTWDWDAPTASSAPLTGFTVVAEPEGQKVEVGPFARGATVAGLDEGRPTTFRVTAANAAAVSPPSAPSDPVVPDEDMPAPPAAPGDVKASAVNGAARVTWTPPASDGGSPLTGYTVTASPGGAFVSVGRDATSATLPGLDNDTSYTVAVTASSLVAESAPSVSAPVTPEDSLPLPPASPTGVRAEAGDRSATVSWSAPRDDGSEPITGYTVTSSPGGVVVTVSPGARSAVVPDLSNGTGYTFTVTAANTAGDSAPSDASAAVEPTPASSAPGPGPGPVPAAPAPVSAAPAPASPTPAPVQPGPVEPGPGEPAPVEEPTGDPAGEPGAPEGTAPAPETSEETIGIEPVSPPPMDVPEPAPTPEEPDAGALPEGGSTPEDDTGTVPDAAEPDPETVTEDGAPVTPPACEAPPVDGAAGLENYVEVEDGTEPEPVPVAEGECTEPPAGEPAGGAEPEEPGSEGTDPGFPLSAVLAVPITVGLFTRRRSAS